MDGRKCNQGVVKAMTSRDRLLAVFRGEPTDRVPISTYELVGWNPDSWENAEPSYRGLMALIREQTDCMYLLDAPCVRMDPRLLTVKRWERDGVRFTRTTCRGPRGELTSLRREQPSIKTVWEVERFLKTEEDIENFLAIPLVAVPPEPADFARRADGLGEHGIMMPSVSDALCVTAELFTLSTFLILCATAKNLIRAIMDKVQETLLASFDALLAAGYGPLFRICGPEYATPPHLPPAFFDELVVAYDKPLIERIHRAGLLARLHSHGKIARALDAIRALAPDGLDPVEPAPDGDITLAEVKRRTGGRITLAGNLELKHLEHASVDDVVALTRRALAEGMPGGRFVIMPTAAPISIPLSPRTEENYRRFIETAVREGVY
jgi:hypothetical protein